MRSRRLFSAAAWMSPVLLVILVLSWLDSMFFRTYIPTFHPRLVISSADGAVRVTLINPKQLDICDIKWVRTRFVRISDDPGSSGITSVQLARTWLHTSLTLPYWSIGLLAAIMPLAWWVQRRRILKTRLIICCECGYDLRFNSGRCPECGFVVGVILTEMTA